MKKLYLLFVVIFASLTMNAQSFDFYISDPNPAPDSLKFCMGETVTFTLDYQGWGWSDWYMCSEEPDLDGWSNWDKWESVFPTDTTYTLSVDKELYFWVKVSEDFSSVNSEVFHIRLNGDVPELVYSDTTFCEGSIITISSSITGLGTGYYKWYKDETEIAGQTDESIDITEPGTYYVEALSNETGCPDSYYASEAVNFSYIKAAVTGTYKPDLSRVTLETSQNYASYQWYESATVDGALSLIAGADTYMYNATVTSTDTYYAVEITTDGGCVSMSDRVLINDSLYSEPVLFDVANNYVCRDEIVTLSLENEGYASYQWYKNGSLIWNATNSTFDVSANYPGGSGIYTVKVKTGIDEATEFESNTIELTFAVQPSISVVDNATLCPGTNVSLEAKQGYSGPVGGYDSYQWYFNDVNDFSSAVEIANATDSVIEIAVPQETRYYWVVTTMYGCEDMSNSKNVSEFELSAPYISATPWDKMICMGDTVNLKVYTTDVTYQWFFNGELIDGATESEFKAAEVGYYDIEITSTVCAEADPVMNNDSVVVSYKFQPEFIVDPFGTLYNDIPNHHIFCAGEEINLIIQNSENYSSMQWMGKLFSPTSTTDEWEDLPGATDSLYSFINGENNKLHFKVRVDSIMANDEVCTSISDYKTIDGWVFQSPAIASYDNSELCDIGDSTLLHLGFPGEWEKYEWYVDGVLVPNSNTDTIYAKETGMWTITAYPTKCPDIPHSSGVGPTVKIMPDAEIFENDELIYAMPEYGVYNYQWYFNGEPIDPNTLEIPWVIYKADLQVGSYTVEVTNPTGCVRLSEPYTVVGFGEAQSGINIYPNPVNNTLNISLENINGINTIEVYTATGQLVETISDVQYSQSIDFSSQISGLFLIKVNYTNSTHSIYKVVKN